MRYALIGISLLVASASAAGPAAAHHRGVYDPRCPVPYRYVVPPPRVYYPYYPPVYVPRHAYVYPRIIVPHRYAPPRYGYHHYPPRGGATFYFRF